MRVYNEVCPITAEMQWIATHPNDPWLSAYIQKHTPSEYQTPLTKVLGSVEEIAKSFAKHQAANKVNKVEASTAYQYEAMNDNSSKETDNSEEAYGMSKNMIKLAVSKMKSND